MFGWKRIELLERKVDRLEKLMDDQRWLLKYVAEAADVEIVHHPSMSEHYTARKKQAKP